MQEEEEDNDITNIANGLEFFELIEDIDNLSFDVSVSKETSVSAIRYIHQPASLLLQ